MTPKIFKYDVEDAIRIRANTPHDADRNLEKFFEAVNVIAYRMGISIQHGSITQEQTDA